ncbi:unnamed protein product [Clonostachys rosea]|uniref:DUF7600 domain-containing protein n=1 Tax=Bionectria ochroleuca TaxID=29856 RepID=A0ABY6UKS5_BIOOC|nr:unnamed protein product [Clonostachys rosea]
MIGPCCSLCGGPYRPRRRATAGNLERPHWATLGRLVRGPQDPRSLDEPILTGVGYVTNSSNLRAPAAHTASYADVSPEEHGLADYDLRVCTGAHRPFAFHEFCWQLLLTRIGAADSQHDWELVGAWLFHVLNSLSWAETGDLIPKHRYYGAIKLRQAIVSPGRPNMLLADPSQHVPVTTTHNGPQTATPVPTFRQRSLIRPPVVREDDPFTRLPMEVISNIFIFLPSKDVCAARLASRHLAVVCYMNSLPQCFWASRFSPDREMGFVFPELLPLHNKDRWLRTYLECKQTLKDQNQLAFRNRARIWRCLEGVAIILDALLHHRKARPIQVVYDAHSLGQKIACPELPYRFEFHNPKFGARSREQHHFTIRNALRVQVSVIRLDSATYISGMRIISRVNRGGERVVQEAGLIVPSNLTSISVLPGRVISSIDVYISPSGIHGLRFSFTRTTHTQHVGDTYCASNVIGMARLTAKCGIAGLIVGFDFYKAVSIQLVEQQATTGSLIFPTAIWNPTIPATGVTQCLPPMELEPRTESQFSVNIYMPFGGEHGSRLALLCGMTAFMHGIKGVYGLLFTYSDGQQLWYGQREALLGLSLKSCVEQTFPINGRIGECINFFDATPSETEFRDRYIVERIRVGTNFGRKYTFGALTSSVDISEPQISPRTTSEEFRITALIGRVSSPLWAFENLKAEKILIGRPGVQRRRGPFEFIDTPSITPSMVTDLGWKSLGEGPCFTIASLENVRSIHVSKGADGRSRTNGNVAGILLNYDRGHRAVVGQWMKETDSYSFRERERVAEVSFWINTDRALNPESERVGTVTGIRLVTSLGKNFTRSITWIFDSSEDEIQVGLQPARSLGNGHLCLAHSKRDYRPLDRAEGNTRIYFNFDRIGFNEVEARAAEVRMIYYHIRRLFFFQKIDRHGNQIPFQQIKLTANAVRELVGIEFQYADGSVDACGTNDGTSTVLRLDTARGERCSRLVVYTYDRGPGAIEFYTTLDRSFKAGTRPGMPVSVASFPLDVGVARTEIDVPYLPPERVFNHGLPMFGPAERVLRAVGIWVVSQFPDREQIEIYAAGPIYLTRLR